MTATALLNSEIGRLEFINSRSHCAQNFRDDEYGRASVLPVVSEGAQHHFVVALFGFKHRTALEAVVEQCSTSVCRLPSEHGYAVLRRPTGNLAQALAFIREEFAKQVPLYKNDRLASCAMWEGVSGAASLTPDLPVASGFSVKESLRRGVRAQIERVAMAVRGLTEVAVASDETYFPRTVDLARKDLPFLRVRHSWLGEKVEEAQLRACVTAIFKGEQLERAAYSSDVGKSSVFEWAIALTHEHLSTLASDVVYEHNGPFSWVHSVYFALDEAIAPETFEALLARCKANGTVLLGKQIPRNNYVEAMFQVPATSLQPESCEAFTARYNFLFEQVDRIQSVTNYWRDEADQVEELMTEFHEKHKALVPVENPKVLFCRNIGSYAGGAAQLLNPLGQPQWQQGAVWEYRLRMALPGHILFIGPDPKNESQVVARLGIEAGHEEDASALNLADELLRTMLV